MRLSRSSFCSSTPTLTLTTTTAGVRGTITRFVTTLSTAAAVYHFYELDVSALELGSALGVVVAATDVLDVLDEEVVDVLDGEAVVVIPSVQLKQRVTCAQLIPMYGNTRSSPATNLICVALI